MNRSDCYRTRNGVRQKLCGGYVSWDGRGKDQHGFPVRRQAEVRVWLPATVRTDDCGDGTEVLISALVAKVEKKVGTGRHVECRECWDY